MKEMFRDIKNYEGLYQISNKGRIKSITDAAKENNIKSVGNICQCCNGEYNTAGGYIWKYDRGDVICQ